MPVNAVWINMIHDDFGDQHSGPGESILKTNGQVYMAFVVAVYGPQEMKN